MLFGVGTGKIIECTGEVLVKIQLGKGRLVRMYRIEWVDTTTTKSTGSRTGQVKNKESYNSRVKNYLSASVGRHHPMIMRQMRLLNGGGG